MNFALNHGKPAERTSVGDTSTMLAASPKNPNSPKEILKEAQFLKTALGVLYRGDARLMLAAIDRESVDCIIGSPPYFSVRDYSVEGQIGLEPTVEAYIEALCSVYDAARVVLKGTGSCWVNMGDIYIDKDLALMPARFALAMKARGWILRNDVIWRKTRTLPNPAKDRLVSKHEHIFHFVKDAQYYYDLDSIRLPHKPNSLKRVKSVIKVSHKGRYGKDEGARGRTIDALDESSALHAKGKNPGDVFDACPSNAADGHLATYPPELIEPRIISTCPRNGTVMDFWMGSGTTALVAEKLSRHWVGVELNADYCKITQKRLAKPLQRELLR
jgi:site-specific DNA-methyltransferase (adenine-specific)